MLYNICDYVIYDVVYDIALHNYLPVLSSEVEASQIEGVALFLWHFLCFCHWASRVAQHAGSSLAEHNRTKFAAWAVVGTFSGSTRQKLYIV
jgi:hypothetical protein